MRVSKTILIFLSSLFMMVAYNYTFFVKSFDIFGSYSFLFSLGITLFLFIALLIVLFDSRWSLKPFIIFFFLLGSITAYFTNEYGVIIDDKMVQNAFETDISESVGLFSFKLLVYFLFLGVLPSYFVFKTKMDYPSFKNNIIYKIKMFIIIVSFLGLNIYLFSKAYTSFFREYKILRFQTIPTYPFYSWGYYLHEKYWTKKIPFTKIGEDAKLIKSEGKPKLMIFILGEAARWDHFSINGYEKETNPLMQSDSEIISLKNFYSCGTETAVSVPCMFSDLTRKEYNNKKAKNRSSLIDVLKGAGVRVLWIDNNSNSKGVAVRIKNYKSIKDGCNGECRDEVMLKGLEEFLKEPKTTFIVLHQMGSHGPKYYKRYDKKYEKFRPVCKTNQLQKCSKDEISNAYDNTIVYTDFFIEEVKKLLKDESKKYRVALWYASDHGESLGENGIYLHGLPYFLAPEAQKHPASILWFSDEFGVKKECIKNLSEKKLSQDNIFSSVLKVMGVKTKVYDEKLDMFAKCKQ